MAETVAFLISAHTSLQNVSGESCCDPHAERILASVSGKVAEALSALDYLSVAHWISGGSTAIGAEMIPTGGSVERASRMTHQHTVWRSKRFAPPSPTNFYDSE
jgi:hypothetical protein